MTAMPSKSSYNDSWNKRIAAICTVFVLSGGQAAAGPEHSDKVSGHVDLEMGRVELKSCLAYPDGDTLRISLEAFEYTAKDREAYRKQGIARDLAIVDVDDAHPIPAGYGRHPGMGISLTFASEVNYDAGSVTRQKVSLYGTGAEGDPQQEGTQSK